MPISVDQSRISTVLFVTDPLCSWCWGTLPQVTRVRDALQGRVQFDLIMGGLQIGPREGLVAYDRKRLVRLWREVHAVTGQVFSERIPEGFVYHSEIACRAVEIARRETKTPPWDFFQTLQAAFYEEGRDISNRAVLAELLTLSESATEAALNDETIIRLTRENFALTETLSANALPNLLLDKGEGYKLVCGGYVTAEYLLSDLEARLGL